MLADTLFIIGVNLVQDPGKSDKVCRPCARKIRNAADCITFITGKLTEDNAEPEEQKSIISTLHSSNSSGLKDDNASAARKPRDLESRQPVRLTGR